MGDVVAMIDSNPSHTTSDMYARFAQVYKKNDILMTEGEESDDSIYLLLEGSVGIFRKIDGRDVLIDCIDAVNFFGEFEAINGGKRLSTVKVLTETLSTYKFLRSDLQTIIQNKEWVEMLLIRLSKDLMSFANRYVVDEASISRLLDEKDETNKKLAELFLLINQVLNNIIISETLPIQSREPLIALIGMIKNYLACKLPEINNLIENTGTPDFRNLYKENLIPEKIATNLTKYY